MGAGCFAMPCCAGLPPSMGVAGYGMGGLPGLPGGLGFPLAGGSGGKLSEPLQGLGGQVSCQLTRRLQQQCCSGVGFWLPFLCSLM